MSFNRIKYNPYFYLVLFIATVILANWSLWHSPWRIGTVYRFFIDVVFLFTIAIYFSVKYLKKMGARKRKQSGLKNDCTFNVIRTIDVYDKKTGNQIGEIILHANKFPLKELKNMLGKNRKPDDDHLYILYEIQPYMKDYFEKHLDYPLDFGTKIYTLACYPTEKKVNTGKGIRPCNI